ncbi:MFS transporter [Kineobactrum sediminis]|nr:MFS transporter [Kineobactrum sediminis]
MRIGLFLLMALVGLNLRPALSSLAPLLARVQLELGLSAAAIGVLTTLPVLCLGLFAPAAPWLSRRIGIERTLSIALLLLAVALLLRAGEGLWPLFAGTAMAGAAIGIAGTVLPVLVKRELPRGADLVTGFYTMALCLGGALGAGLSIPLAEWLGSWQRSLGSWALPALVALVCWWAMMPQPIPRPGHQRHGIMGTGLLRSPLAWQVTLLMGCQSSMAYIVFGWLPTLLQRRDIGEAEAGVLLGASVFVQLFSALGAPWLARLGRDERPALLLLLALIGAGFYCLLLGPPVLRWPGVVALGLGQGGSFSLALTLLVLRSSTPAIAGQLSAMTQGIGYCLAALGPLLVGVLLHFEASIGGIWALLTGLVVAAMLLALLAGRNRHLDIDEQGRFITRQQQPV